MWKKLRSKIINKAFSFSQKSDNIFHLCILLTLTTKIIVSFKHGNMVSYPTRTVGQFFS